MFWGLNLKPNRKYTQTTEKSFHISGAALDVDSASAGGSTQICISNVNQKFLICTLRKGGPEQVMLDLNFAEGEKICFQSVGNGNVTLTGYIIDNFMSDQDDDDDDDAEEEAEQITDLRKALQQKSKKKMQAVENIPMEDEEDDSEDDPDFNGTAEVDSDAEQSAEGEEEADSDEDDENGDEEDEEDDDDEEEEDDESDEEEVQQPKAKQPKLEKQAKQNGNVVDKVEKKKNKKEAAQPEKQQQKQKQNAAGAERTITGGVKIIDLREGTGPEAKVGKRAQVYYEGRLKSNNKIFDSMKNGPGFKFHLGRGEVIKGWDVGVVGMKVGGKRRIICPAHMAYGARGSPPTIPPNSTLVFEVELKGVN